MKRYTIILLLMTLFSAPALRAEAVADSLQAMVADSVVINDSDTKADLSGTPIVIDGISAPGDTLDKKGHRHIETIYAFPQASQLSFQHRDWKRMWINGATLTGAFVAALTVMETLPDDATAWSRADIRSTPFYKRWYRNIFKKGFEWDSDKPVFNLILHPYAGAVYFMGARSCGFSFWGSLAFCSVISTVGWELGIEACNERPSIQDIFVTPLVGSAIGEGFFQLKRHIVSHDYRLFGSPVIGNVVAFLIDPVNEVVGLFAGNPARRYAKARRLEIQTMPVISSCGGSTNYGFSIQAVF